MIAIAEFSGYCRGNPVKISRNLRAVGGRIVSYDSETRVIMGTLRINILNTQELEMKRKLFEESVLRDISDCRLWIKIVPETEISPRLRKRSIMKVSSNTSEVLVLRLKNYVYALWNQKKAGTTRLIPVSEVARWYPGELSELVYSCEKLSELLNNIREDLIEIVRGDKQE